MGRRAGTARRRQCAGNDTHHVVIILLEQSSGDMATNEAGSARHLQRCTGVQDSMGATATLGLQRQVGGRTKMTLGV